MVSEFIRLVRCFSMMTLVPDRVVKPGFPVVIGIVRSRVPLDNTRIWCVWALTL